MGEGGGYYVKGFVQIRDGDGAEAYRERKLSKTVFYYPHKKVRYEELEEEDFCPESPTIYEVLWNGITYEFLVSHHPGDRQAVIFGSGSINGEMELPIFRRNSWADYVPHTTIWYFDPTLYAFDRESLRSDIYIAWGYGTNERWVLKDIAHLLRKILARQNIMQEDVLFFGSSGGGYMSMVLAAMFKGKATVINPQFFAQNFNAKQVEDLGTSVLRPGEEFITERLDVLKVFEREGYFPQIHVMQNLQAGEDIHAQIMPLLHRLSEMDGGCGNWFSVEFYSMPGGHNAQPDTGTCLAAIRKDLGVPPATGNLES